MKRINLAVFLLTITATCQFSLGEGVKVPKIDPQPKSSLNEPESKSEDAAKAVSGTIQDTAVEMTNAKMGSQLAIFEGRGWASDPSLLIFLFLDSGTIPEGREFIVDAETKFQAKRPHVHYRWRDPESGGLMSKVASSKYDMRLVFGEVEDGELPGTIEFSVPGEPTKVAGKFRAKIKK